MINIQTLVLFYKEDRRVVATFRFQNAVVGAEVLATPGMAYLFTFENNIFYHNSKGETFVRNI